MAIRNGSVLPSDLTDAVICRSMGWSWRELMETPAHVVDDVRVMLSKMGAVARG